MLQRLLTRLVPGIEERLGVRLEYLRLMAAHAPGALWRLLLFMPLAAYERSVPTSLLHLARLGATLSEDCGECVEITVNVARQEGVSAEVLRAGITRDASVLGANELAALDYGSLLVQGDRRADDVRRELEELYGTEGVIEFATAVASAQLFTTVKRGMGLSQRCDVPRMRELAA